MASINGDWFHSRTSSNLSELLKVRDVILESQEPQYRGFRWGGGLHGSQLADAVGMQPPTMRTKIRAMIRYGFIREGNNCPLVWTQLGDLWNKLYTIGNDSAAKSIYELTLAISLALYAFNDSPDQFTMNPARGEMPLKFLFNILDNTDSISLSEFEVLVDGDTSRVGPNTSYWIIDLVNSGLFREEQGRLIYTGKFPGFVQEIKNFDPNPLLEDDDWIAIRDNPIIENSPFRDSIKAIFRGLSQERGIEDQLVDEIYTDPLIDIVAQQEETNIPEVDILSSDLRFSQNTRRIRNATWALRIKKKYNYICAVPNCDANGLIFVNAAHIKPDNAPESSVPHRAHILNGICLCRNCHAAFDRGYFSLTDDHRIIISSMFDQIPNQHLKTIIVSSSNIRLKPRIDNRLPLPEFIQYHRTHYFKA
jgi:hypothetical protein